MNYEHYFSSLIISLFDFILFYHILFYFISEETTAAREERERMKEVEKVVEVERLRAQSARQLKREEVSTILDCIIIPV